MTTIEQKFHELFPNFNGEYLDLVDYDIKELPDLPKLKNLNLQYSTLTKLPCLPNLEYLNLGFSGIKTLPNLPNLECLVLNRSKIKELPELENLRRLYLSDSIIKELPIFENLKLLSLGSSKIKKIPIFPKLIDLDTRYSTSLKEIPSLPNLEALDINSTPVVKIGDMKLDYFFFKDNKIKSHDNWIFSENIGSRFGRTSYNIVYDRVICGCFKGTLESFERKVNITYSPDCNEYCSKFRTEYLDFISLIKSKINL